MNLRDEISEAIYRHDGEPGHATNGSVDAVFKIVMREKEYGIKYGHALGWNSGQRFGRSLPCETCGYAHTCKHVTKTTIGFLFRLTSFWFGVHYSKRERRCCINLLPGLTIWIAKPGGQRP